MLSLACQLERTHARRAVHDGPAGRGRRQRPVNQRAADDAIGR